MLILFSITQLNLRKFDLTQNRTEGVDDIIGENIPYFERDVKNAKKNFIRSGCIPLVGLGPAETKEFSWKHTGFFKI
jgi:hypothetical protein